MSFFAWFSLNVRSSRFLDFSVLSLLISLLAVAQVTLKFRLLNGYSLREDASVNKGKPTLFVFEQADTFGQVIKAAGAPAVGVPAAMLRGNRSDRPAEAEMVIGIAVPPATVPLKLSVSRVFVQDSTLTVRYIRMTDTTLTKTLPALRPFLLLALPKQTVLKTKLVENGKVVQTLKRRDTDG